MQAILHNIRSVHNVGSIFRTADGLGVEKLYLTGYTPEPVDRFGRKRQKFSKVALGAEDTVDWESKENILDLINKIASENTTVCACEPTDSAVPVDKLTTRNPSLCLVFGNEVDGLPQDVIEASDQTIKIPMRGTKSSLNVAVAFGIISFCVVDK
ncbi:MAG: RNA methyltransferase [Parcubacteria group bacterium SW_4_46_8]|nr:MAG: RNA methyltransferase [Parcubacteria group bacterium SW_4_46_8]